MTERLTYERIRRAVCRHHGGFDTATHQQILVMWNSLPSGVRKQYLADTPAEASPAAAQSGPETEVDHAAGL